MSSPIQHQYHPDVVSPPGETLAEILEERGMSQAEFAERTGRPKKTINEIIKGKCGITPDTALQFEHVLGTPASFWLNRDRIYQEWLARQEERQALAVHLDWMRKFPVKAMVNLGWINRFDDPIDQLLELLNYFGVASPLQWQNMLEGTQWRQSPKFAADPAAVSAWLRRGELEAQEIECSPYDDASFREALQQVRRLTNEAPDVFVDEMTRVCAQSGVAVVFVPEIRGTRTCGATRWLNSTKALIMLSLRYKTDDHLWFTFFHEAAHILLHGKRDVFLEDGEEVKDDTRKKEDEADRFAEDFLIPPDEMRNFRPRAVHLSHSDIKDFANRLGIAPGIVVGRLQHDRKVPPQNFNDLKQRFQWAQE